MNRFLRKAMVLALTGSMALGMSMTAFTATNSESSYTNGGTVESDTTTINLIKDYVRGTDTASDSVSPAENFVFAITPYGVWNAGSSTGSSDGAAYTVANMPALAKASAGVTVNGSTTTVTITESQGQADRTDGKTEITLNDFQSVGDFWYQVKEAIAKTTGVFYGTNDSQDENIENANGAHDAVYYIHVQVVNNPVGGFFRSVTLHKTAPLANGAAPASNVDYNAWAKANYSEGVKVNDVKNTYYAGDLSITKQVTGNAGDKDKRFEVTVTFTKPAGTIITSDITYSAAGAANETAQTAKDDCQSECCGQ